MTARRFRHTMISTMAALGLCASACTGSTGDDSNGATPSAVDASSAAAGDDQSQVNAGAEVAQDGEDETAIGDAPANGGSKAALNEPSPIVESADGQSSEPVSGGAEPADGGAAPGDSEAGQRGPAMPASAAEVCAVVEFGYLGLLDGDSGADVQQRLRDGATAASGLADGRYASAGAQLLASVGADSMSSSADALLDVCAADGFERLA